MRPDSRFTRFAWRGSRLVARYKAGVDYLLRTQREDGSWSVQSRGFGFQPYVDYGFPHRRSQFLSAAATSWAAMALAPAL